MNSLTRYGLFAGRTERRRRLGRLKCGENLVEFVGISLSLELNDTMQKLGLILLIKEMKAKRG